LSSNTETYWVNGEPFDLVFTTDPAIPKPNTEKYWYNAQPVDGLLELTPDPYSPPYVPPSPTSSPYGEEKFWVNGAPSDQFFPISDITPPTFSGIATLTVGAVGQLLVSWPPAIDISTPITYQVFLQANSSVGLFLPGNVVISTTQTSCAIFAEPDGTLLGPDNYFVAVRAVDAVGNSDTNTFSLETYTAGVEIPVAQGGADYEPRGVFSISPLNQLQGTFWITKDGVQMTSDLGTASYTILDKDGISTGITQAGIAADANGLYKITVVSASPLTSLTHYTVIVQITADTEVKRGSIGLSIAE